MTYIDPRGKVLAHLERLSSWRAGAKPSPVTVEWDLSNRCTLGCMDCHFAHTHVKGPWVSRLRVLPTAYEATGNLADVSLVECALAELGLADVRAVIWSGGGEPTTHPRWEHIIDVAAGCALQQGMYTHGGLLTATSAAHLSDVAEWVVVSLDACSAETYAAEKRVPTSRFDDACRGVVHLIGHKAVIGVSYLLHERNWTQAEDMVALTRQLGASYATFRPAIRTLPSRPAVCQSDRTWITDALPLLSRLSSEPDVEVDQDRFAAYRDWSSHGYGDCRGIRLNTTVTPDGRVWVCPQRRGVSCLGDLRVESFSAIWARHPGRFVVDDGCRVMCRLHAVNQQIAAIEQPRAHEAFV